MLPLCLVCNQPPAATLVERKQFPMFLNSVRTSRDEARALARGDVTFVACGTCGLAWNRDYEPDLHTFDPSYNPDQVGSPAFDRHFAAVADRIAAACAELDRVDLLEIGSGQGDFLQAMADRLGSRLRTARGFDPAFWGGVPRFRDPRIRVDRRYFDDDASAKLEVSPNVIVSRHAVQHISAPASFFPLLRRTIEPNRGKLFLETLDSTWIFEHRTTYDLFYEHCCVYDPASLSRALRDAGFGVTRVELFFTGQNMLVSGGAPGTDAYVAPKAATPRSLLDSDRRFIDSWSSRLVSAKARGPVLLWGAGAKGASFCALIDPEGELLAGVVDIHPGKQGRFVPGTGHAIVAPTDPLVAEAKMIIVSNGTYLNEIRASLATLGHAPELHALDE